MNSPNNAVLLVSCPDRKGLVARITRFVETYGGNIEDLDQHVDLMGEVFFMRMEWDLKDFSLSRDELAEHLEKLAAELNITWRLYFTDCRPRMAIFVSKYTHCLYDLLARHESREWRADIPVIISNHPDVAPIAERFGLRFECFPITKDNKHDQEQRQIALLRELTVDTVVMARYMQILSPLFIEAFPNRVINIHHSFLPAFMGAKPYHSAYARGVKIIGATSHYATVDLDQGPIIEQDVIRVSHRDSIPDMIRRGRDLEKVVLSRAVYWHLNHRVLVHGNRTVVFA